MKSEEDEAPEYTINLKNILFRILFFFFLIKALFIIIIVFCFYYGHGKINLALIKYIHTLFQTFCYSSMDFIVNMA